MGSLLDFWAAYGSTATFAMVNSFFALSAYAVLSAGVLSFATVTLAAVGGFVAAQAVAQFDLSIYFALPLAALSGGLAAAIVASLFLRLETHWVALASLALVLITRVVILNAPTLTGGVNGLIVPATISQGQLFVLLVVVAFVFYRLHNSWYGLASRAVREDAAVASTMGISPFCIRFVAFVISGVVGGLGGAALAFTLQFISADTYFVGLAFTMIASTVLGGSFHWFGPIVGALIFTALPAIMQAIVPAIEDVGKGVALILIMFWLPRGLIDPRAVRLRRAARLQRESESPMEGRTIVLRSSEGQPVLLDIDNVVKRFGGVAALGGLAASVREGSVHGLIGPNGAGKTTLINVITGLFTPDSGAIHFAGRQLDRLTPPQIVALGITRTYQNVRLFSGMSVLEQVMTGCYLARTAGLTASFLGLPSARRDGKRVRDQALELLRRVAMDDRADELAETLSYGDQRRIEIARALGSNPRLLLLDEPTAGMNQSEATAVGRLVHDLRDGGLTVLMVEHNVGLVIEFCDRCTVMNFGQLLAEGDPKTCIADPDVQEAYFGRKKDAERFEALR